MMRSVFPVVLAASFLACVEPAPPPSVVQPSPPKSVAAQPEKACSFKGVVRSDSGAPIAGALIAVTPPEAEPAAFAKSDAAGRYCVEGLAAGEYGFTVNARAVTATYIDVRAIALGDTIDVTLGGPGFVLSGTAADDRGTALGSSKIYIPRFSSFKADMFVAETDAEGRFEIKLPVAKYAPAIRSDRHISPPASADLDQDRRVDLKAVRLAAKATLAPDEVVAWIRKSAVALKTPEAGRGLEDMAPIATVVGGAEIVALGEATHGTREFFQLKHRMLEFLVEKMGFRSFGIEASFADCLPIGEYVRTGKGDPAFALANQRFWTWDTEEVLELIRWMRRYNEDKAHKEKLSFWGFDMQFPAASAAAVLTYFHAVDPAFEQEIAPLLEPIDDDFSAGQSERLSPEAREKLIAAVKKVSDKLAEAPPKGKKVSDDDLRILRIHSRVLSDYVAHSSHADPTLRDRAMADIAADLVGLEARRAPKGALPKMVLWAHNGHVSKADNGGAQSMGAHLRQRFGDKYLAFGFAFDEGSFQAMDMGPADRGLVPFTVTSAAVGGLDHTLARAGIPLFALDLRAPPPGPVRDFWTSASFSRSIGSMFADNVSDFGFSPAVPRDHFDALLFVQKTTAARPNATGRRDRDSAKKPPNPGLEDPGFEAAKAGELPAWLGVTASPKQLVYKAEVVGKGCATGKQCLHLHRVKGDVPIGIGTAATRVDATPYRGKKVLVRATAKSVGKAHGDEAFVFASTSAAKGQSEKLSWAPVSSTSWSRVSFEVEVPSDAPSIVIALAVTGAASAWVDDLEVSVP